jgi:hypothetical protein
MIGARRSPGAGPREATVRVPVSPLASALARSTVRSKSASRRRASSSRAAPVQKGATDLGLQPPHLGAESRLGKVQARRGTGEVKLLADRDEVSELT